MDPEGVTDDELIAAMLGRDLALVLTARRIYDARHSADPAPAEPRHCEHCFEGCPRCQPR